MPQPTELLVCLDEHELASRAAAFVARIAEESIAARGQFTVALAGGSTPQPTYAQLASPAAGQAIDWSRTFVFFGDERFVPQDDPRSNFHMARESLLSKISIPSGHIFAVRTDLPTPEAAAADYDQTVSQFFELSSTSDRPVFDLILLGLGDDGHTASLFPHAQALRERDVLVTASPPGVLPPPVPRVTFTFETLNEARQIAFLVAGEKKAEVVRDVLQGRATVDEMPAIGVAPRNGRITWLVDRPAAKLVTSL